MAAAPVCYKAGLILLYDLFAGMTFLIPYYKLAGKEYVSKEHFYI